MVCKAKIWCHNSYTRERGVEYEQSGKPVGTVSVGLEVPSSTGLAKLWGIQKLQNPQRTDRIGEYTVAVRGKDKDL